MKKQYKIMLLLIGNISVIGGIGAGIAIYLKKTKTKTLSNKTKIIFDLMNNKANKELIVINENNDILAGNAKLNNLIITWLTTNNIILNDDITVTMKENQTSILINKSSKDIIFEIKLNNEKTKEIIFRVRRVENNFQYLDFSKMEVVDSIISALGKSKIKTAEENKNKPVINTNGSQITLPKSYTKTTNDIINLKIVSIGEWIKEKFYILAKNVVISNGITSITYNEIKLDSFKFDKWITSRIEMKHENVTRITTWADDLSAINWEGVIGLTTSNTPFQGDISGLRIVGPTLNGATIGNVTKWPNNLSSINWEKIKGITSFNTPFQGDIGKKTILGSTLKGIDVSNVKIWPNMIFGINWGGVIGLTSSNTPFQGDISNKIIIGSTFKGIDVSKVKTWPRSGLNGINWEGVTGLTSSNTPFQGDISQKRFNAAINKKTIFNGVDISKVTNWSKRLSGINWGGVTGLTTSNTPFQGDISKTSIFNSILKEIDISLVTKWPPKLSEINWSGVKYKKNSTGIQSLPKLQKDLVIKNGLKLD